MTREEKYHKTASELYGSISISPYASDELVDSVARACYTTIKNDKIIDDWREYENVKMSHPDDGWVYRAKEAVNWYNFDNELIGKQTRSQSRVFDEMVEYDDICPSYPTFYKGATIDTLKEGDRVCLGDWGNERILKIKKIIRKGTFLPIIKLEPDEEFLKKYRTKHSVKERFIIDHFKNGEFQFSDKQNWIMSAFNAIKEFFVNFDKD